MSTRKLMAIPDNLLQLVEVKAKRYGLNLQEYVRLLMVNDVKSLVEPSEQLDPQTLADLAEGVEDARAGRVIALHSLKEIDKYFDKF